MQARVTNNLSFAKMTFKLILASLLLFSFSGFAYDYDHGADDPDSIEEPVQDQDQQHDHDQDQEENSTQTPWRQQISQHNKTSTRHPKAQALQESESQIFPEQTPRKTTEKRLRFTPIGEQAHKSHKARKSHKSHQTHSHKDHTDGDGGADNPRQPLEISYERPEQKLLYERYGIRVWGQHMNYPGARSIPTSYNSGEKRNATTQQFVNHYYNAFSWVANVKQQQNMSQGFSGQHVNNMLFSGNISHGQFRNAQFNYVIFGNSTIKKGLRKIFCHRTDFEGAQFKNTTFTNTSFKNAKWKGADLWQDNNSNPKQVSKIIFDGVKFDGSGLYGANLHVNGEKHYVDNCLSTRLKEFFGDTPFFGDLADLVSFLETKKLKCCGN